MNRAQWGESAPVKSTLTTATLAELHCELGTKGV